MAIHAVIPTQPSLPTPAIDAGVSPTKNGSGPEFGKLISDFLRDVSAGQSTADTAVQQLIDGKVDSIHDVAISMAKADLSFRLMLEIRNRLIEAYQEIMRMQV